MALWFFGFMILFNAQINTEPWIQNCMDTEKENAK